MATSRRAFVRGVVLILCITALYNLYGISRDISKSFKPKSLFGKGKSQYPSKQMLESLVLTTEQCAAAFPGLTKEIDDAVTRGPFQFNRSVDDYTGQIQGRIKDRKLFIITADTRSSRDMLYERSAVLHQLHRAIITSPEPLPNTIFALSVLDGPRERVWSFSRPTYFKEQGTYWIMPHFNFWSWPKTFIGTMDQALANIQKVEEETPWVEKIDKAVWRGTVWFNSIANINLRPQLMQRTKGKEWADVEDMRWENQGESAANAIAIADFCKYKYVLYTEGVTYSGRLPFHQACASVMITPAPNYLLHTTHLMRPLLSSSLPFSTSKESSNGAGAKLQWPQSYSTREANVVFVDSEWADLEQTIFYLRENPEIAEGIAKRQRAMVVEAGYLSLAAEACYWRALIRGWSKVAMPNEEQWGINGSDSVEGVEGMRWETFSLLGKTSWN